VKTFVSIVFVSFFALTAACVTQADDEGPDTCVGAECDDPDPCTGDGCNVDPPVGSDDWVCRSGVKDGLDYFECNQRDYAPPSSVGATAYFVGNCSTEGLAGYWDGRVLPDAIVDGWPRLYLEGQSGSQHCEITLAFCDRANDADCWLQYGPEEATPEVAGEYRECGVRGGVEACGMFFIRKQGKIADSLGYYPN